MRIAKVGVIIAALSICLNPLKAYSCGPFFDETIFNYQFHPDLPLKFFAGGKLGVLEPSFARSYLLCAYRDLTGKPLTDAEQKSIIKVWESRMTNGDAASQVADTAMQGWLKERNKLPGIKKIEMLSTDRATTSAEDDTGNMYLNCPEDAFKGATEILKQKVSKFGATSAAVKDWVGAQDAVFSHCAGPDYKWDAKKYAPEPPFPAPAPATADATTRSDRAYQIAAANFYAQKFDQAAQEFDAIAKDENSPYHAIAPYLAARCMLRKGTLPKKYNAAALQNAQKRLKDIIDDSRTTQDIRATAKKLLNFVAVKESPEATLKALAIRLASGAANDEFGQDVIDYTTMLDTYFGWSADSDATAAPKLTQVPASAQSELTEWIVCVQGTDAASQEAALKKWESSKSPLWLIPAIMREKSGGKDSAALIDAALTVPPSSSAYLTARYYAVKLLVDAKDGARAKKAIDEVLAQKDLPPSAVNLFLDQKVRLVKNLAEFWPDAVRISSGAMNDSMGVETPDDLDKVEARTSWYVGPSAFSPSAANIINQSMPLTVLASAAWSNWATAQKRDFLQAVWTRAVLLNDDKVAMQVTPLLASQNPLLTRLMNEYKTAANPDQKQFLSAYIFVTNPAMRPYVTPGTARQQEFNKIEDFQDNWWCATGPSTSDNGDTPQKPVKTRVDFLTAAQVAQATAEDKRLLAAGSGPTYILSQLLAYAKKPGAKDKRLPEALYHAIRSPKFACGDKTTSALSKAAFQLMHKQYPHDPWTAKTQYWY
ncbi:MAG TPA: hypothetical protein V6C86_11665 [Oculatellaceae cyanobacterium]|jgi:hypothetical protein